MKLNWGNYLIMGMGAFMVFIISMGVYMFAQTKDDYDKQYYEKGINFDQDFNREKQVFADRAVPKVSFDAQNMLVQFAAPAKGKLRFTRAADRWMDKVFPVECIKAADPVIIPLTALAKGPYKLRVEWQSNLKQYLYEQDITIK
ncbi:FixH family protein [Mucilaginibacter sp. PAMB04274]|uniref:FixH family protein n=1 Tax=Mucilaginibacter sp. PAMB04274 TaxID=3138568 RepID=UPI0031F6137E